MAHPVEINELNLQAKAAAMRAKAADLAGEYSPPALVDGETVNDLSDDVSALETWKSAVDVGLTLFHGEIMPEWEISGKGREIIVEGLAEQFAEWWPDGVYDLGKLPPWAKGLAGLIMIVFANFDRNKMELKPMKPLPPEEPEPEDVVIEKAAPKRASGLLSEEDRA